MNIPLVLIPITVGLIAQLLKTVDDTIDKKRFNRRSIYASGGFPSVHSAFTSSVTTMTGLEFGFGSGIFAVAFIFSALFWYDAVTLRYQAGQHASSLNKINKQLFSMLEDEREELEKLLDGGDGTGDGKGKNIESKTTITVPKAITPASLLEATTWINAPAILKERLGHKLYEVIGGIIVGSSLTVIIIVYIFGEPRGIAG